MAQIKTKNEALNDLRLALLEAANHREIDIREIEALTRGVLGSVYGDSRIVINIFDVTQY